MSNEWMYLVFVLLYTLAESLPVNDLKIDQLLQTCSLNISSTVNVKKFKELCSETQNAVDFKNVEEEKFLFDFETYLCYTVKHNVRALCDSQHNQNSFSPVSVETEPAKFCSAVPAVNITKSCNHWLEDPGQSNEDDCVLVSRVVEAIMVTGDRKGEDNLCHETCIRGAKLNPVCVSLVETSLILAQVAKTSKTTPPPAPDVPPAPAGGEVQAEAEAGHDGKLTSVAADSGANSTSDLGEVALADNAEDSSLDKNIKKIVESKDNISTTDGEYPSSKSKKEEQHVNVEVKQKPSISTTMSSSSSTTKIVPSEADTEPLVLDDTEDTHGENNGETEPIEGNLEDSDMEYNGNDTPEGKDDPVAPVENGPIKTENEPSFSGSIGSGPDIEDESHFFSYFMLLSVVAIIAYMVFHNKQKVTRYI